MPLIPYLRGNLWWAKGRIEYNGRPISEYYRKSTGASDEAGARDWCRAEEDRAIRRHLVGAEEEPLTFADAVLLYPTSAKTARMLLPIVASIGDTALSEITPRTLRDLGPKLRPEAGTDTWWREIVTPARAVINNAHDLGKCPPIKVRRYTQMQRVQQDQARGKVTRVPRVPATRDWLEAFRAAADPYNRAMAAFMFETAARVGQAVALRPRDLDLMNGRVRLKAQKGHPEQWVTISRAMVVELANLPPRKPVDSRRGTILPARVFGYATPTGYRGAWLTICKRAGIPYLSAHAAGRHGFFTELTVRQGVDPVTAAAAGRWADVTLPLRIYAHAEADEAAIRERIRTPPVQDESGNPDSDLSRKAKS